MKPSPTSPYVLALEYVDQRFADSEACIDKISSINFDGNNTECVEIKMTVKIDVGALAAAPVATQPSSQ